MPRHRFLCPFLALAAAGLLVGPAAAGDKASELRQVQEQLQQLDVSLNKVLAKVSEEMRSVQRELKTAKEERADVQLKLQAALGKVETLDRAVAGLRVELDVVKGRGPTDLAAPPDRAALDEIRSRLTRIEQMLAPPPQARVSLYAPEPKRPAADRDRFKEVRERLDRMDSSLRQGMEQVGRDMHALRRDVDELKDDRDKAWLKVQSTLAAVNSVQPQLSELRAELESLKRRGPATVALYPPADPPARVSYYQAAPPVGRLLLANHYGEEMTFVVNGRSVRVPAGSTVPLEAQPAGALTYEVISPTWGLRGRNTTTLAANETLTITAR